MTSKLERVQKIIANFGSYSRREAERLIFEGRVKVDGRVVYLGDKASVESDIWIDNKKQKLNLKQEYFVLNKPLGYISSRIDEQGKEVISLIENNSNRNYFTIGRLDVNTSGLIIVTTDGNLSKIVNSPNTEIKKTYLVWVDSGLPKAVGAILSKGVKLSSGYITKPAKIKIIKNDPSGSCLKITIIEGKQNQIRKMIESLGDDYRVKNLKRIQIQNIKIDNLKTGEYKSLKKEEIYSLLGLKTNPKKV